MATPVGVLGAGSFGTCLALLAAHQGHDVVLWARKRDVSDHINRERRNPVYLRDAEVPAGVRATDELAEALAGRELVICAVPSHAVREVMAAASPHLADGALVVSTVKGIELQTGMLMHQVLEEVLDPAHHARRVSLSGPSFAREIADRKPTVVALASPDETFAIAAQSTFSCPWFRCYTNPDVVGVEVAGALKNVIAIAVGVCDGLELGLNARAGLMTRGLAEITRIGVRMGANPITFLGLAGMGDLLLTCTGDLSRNRRVGLALGQGRALAEILEEMGQVAEGVRTTQAACELGARIGVELPICEATRDVLDGRATPRETVERLMTRQLGSEVEPD